MVNLSDYRLCYADDDNLWFATCEPLNVRGDDFNDHPWWCNASGPYPWAKWDNMPEYDLVCLKWEGQHEAPTNENWSVDELNEGRAPWLMSCPYGSKGGVIPHPIMAGTPLPNVVKHIIETGGEIYWPTKLKKMMDEISV